MSASATNSAFLVVPMGLKAGVALLMVLLILNSGITDAVRQRRTVDVPRVSDARELSTHHLEKHLIQKDSSLKQSSSPSSWSSSSSSSSSSVGVRVLIGSSAPDCVHTCGACSPCTVQVVSFGCSSSSHAASASSSSSSASSASSSSSSDLHAEACPLGYLCVCQGKAFPIP